MKKLSTLAIVALMLGGIACLTGCGENSESEKAVDAVEGAGENTADVTE